MRGLAEFIMRGRWQALAVAALGAGSLLFGWISAAAIALVTLRKGASDGAWLTLWALLPAGLTAWLSGDPGSVLLLVSAFVLACVLWASVSLALTTTVMVLVGYLSGGALLLFSQGMLEQLVAVFTAVIEQLQASLRAQGASDVVLQAPGTTQVAGILAASNAGIALLSVLLGRYWQAVLYNPGGFGREFRALRLPPALTGALTVLAVSVWLLAPGSSGWAAIAAAPLIFCGFALLHARAAMAGKGTVWLSTAYVLWLVLDPVKLAFMAMVAIDALVNFRSRWQSPRDASGQ